MAKILIVEDDKEIGGMLQNFLRAEGFETDIAPDGEIACRIFFQKEYALILLDL